MLTYNRMIRPDLERVLAPGGVAHGLVERHLADPTHVDLHLRAYPGEARNWVTLYCGLTKPLDLVETRGVFRISTHKTCQAFAPHLPWKQPLTEEELTSLLPKINAYLDEVIPYITATRWFGKEGAVQTAVTRLRHDGITVFDREAVPNFTDTDDKIAVMEEEAKLLTANLSSEEAWWAIPRLGEECDAAALDKHGRLLAVEVKPGNAGSKSITWAPLQAAYYARLFTRWAVHDPSHNAAIDGLIEQRRRLGLTPAGECRAAEPLEVVPVVIIGGGTPSKEVMRRCRLVRSAILDDGLVPELQLWSLEHGVLEALI